MCFEYMYNCTLYSYVHIDVSIDCHVRLAIDANMTFGGLQMLLFDRVWKGFIIWKKKQCAYGNFPQMATFRRWELSTDGNFLRMASFCGW